MIDALVKGYIGANNSLIVVMSLFFSGKFAKIFRRSRSPAPMAQLSFYSPPRACLKSNPEKR